MTELKKARMITHVLYAVLHQRRELGLLAFQEAANERLLEDVHQVDRSQQTTKHLCGLEGSSTIIIFQLNLIFGVLLPRQTPTNAT